MRLLVLIFQSFLNFGLLSVLGYDVCPGDGDCIHIKHCTARHKHTTEYIPPLSKCSPTHDRFCCPPIKSEKLREEVSPFCDAPEEPTKTEIPTTDRRTTRLPILLEEHPNRQLLPKNDCGTPFRYRGRVKRSKKWKDIKFMIADGNAADRGAVPWMVLLYYFHNDDDEPHGACGGTLISSRYVLTAAHCIKENLKYVRIGVHNIDETCETVKNIVRKKQPYLDPERQCSINVNIEKIIKHPLYDKGEGKFKNDIGLLRLAEEVPIEGNEYIHLACLPFHLHPPVHLKEVFFAAGWGMTKNAAQNDREQIVDTLHTVNITGSGVQDCNMCRIKDTTYTIFCELDKKTQLCVLAERSSRDVCHGDSGGPLMVWRHDRWVQVGIVSVKPTGHCGEQGVPSLYTRVDGFLDWILDNIEP